MDQVQEVRARTDIVSLIQEYVPLKKAGRNFKANCPFHQENSPSFFVSPDRQMFHCFGCQKGGDAFTFLMEYEHMEFPESLRFLAKKAGIILVETGKSRATFSKKESFFSINKYAMEFYHYLLMSHVVGKKALSYLEKRGVTEGTMKTFKIGFAPGAGTALFTYLTKKKSISSQDIVEVGLAQRMGGRMVDFFRGRLMFPLIDHRDNVVGFSGRILSQDDHGPKYMNTRDTLLYHKGEHFFGFHIAKEAMRKTDAALIVEGEFDVIACFQEGITYTIALKGTALTERQVNLLSRYVTRVILCLDDDKAGHEAMVRSLSLLESKGLHVSALRLTSGKDPAEELISDPGAFKHALKHDVPIYDFVLEKALVTFDKKTADGKRSIVEFLVPLLSEISNEVVKEHYLRKLSTQLETSYESIQKEASRRLKKPSGQTVLVRRAEKKSREEALEEYLLALLLQFETPKTLIQTSADILKAYMGNERSIQKILHLLFMYSDEHHVFNTKEFELDVPEELKDAFNKAFLFPLSMFKDDAHYEKEVGTVSLELRHLLLRRKLKELARKIREAEKNDEDTQEMSKLQSKFREITSLLSKSRL